MTTATTTISWAGDVPISEIIPDPRQPRKHFDQAALEQLAASITAQGVIEPLIVRPITTGQGDRRGGGPASALAKYVLIAGERRWRAAKMSEAVTVPVIVRAYDPQQAHAVQLAENMDREGLRPLEIAESYHRWLQPLNVTTTTVVAGKLQNRPTYKRTQAELAAALGKTEAHVSQVLALRELPAPVHKLIDDGVLSFAHARALQPLLAYPSALKRVVADIQERAGWGSVWTVRELGTRVKSHLTRVKQAEARREAAKRRKKSGAKPAPRPSWQEDQERYRRQQERATLVWKAGLKAAAPRIAKTFAGDRVQQLVAKIPAALLKPIARGLRIPSWGEDADVVRALKVGAKPARRVAAWLWLQRSLTTTKKQIAAAGAAALKKETK